MDPRQAISDVQQIREQLARAEMFRVYRAASTAVTGVAAFVGAFVQTHWELNDPPQFLLLWTVVAWVCLIVVAVEMAVRCRTTDSVLLHDATILAARQFVPCIVAGGLVTLAVWRVAPASVHLLPGLWGIFFALGIFASRPGLPRSINAAAAHYLLAGLLVIGFANKRATFDVWPMPMMFGIGQVLTAILLYFSGSERSRHEWS